MVCEKCLKRFGDFLLRRSARWQSCAGWQSPEPQAAWTRQLSSSGSSTDTSADTAWKLPDIHENLPGLHSWDVLFHCSLSHSSPKIAKLGHSFLSHWFFTPTKHKSPGHSQIWCSCRLCGCTLCNGFIFACWIGLHGSRSVPRDPPKPLQHTLPWRSWWQASEPDEKTLPWKTLRQEFTQTLKSSYSTEKSLPLTFLFFPVAVKLFINIAPGDSVIPIWAQG